METAIETTTSRARLAAEWIDALCDQREPRGEHSGGLFRGLVGSVSGSPPNGSSRCAVHYYDDHSILCMLDDGSSPCIGVYRPYRILDETRTYYREDVEHAMRCLATHGRDAIKNIIERKYGPGQHWISGVLWDGETGDWLDVQR